MHSPEFPANLIKDLKNIGYEELDEYFLNRSVYHRSNDSVKAVIMEQIQTDCKLMQMVVQATYTDYYYFEMHLPKFVVQLCRTNCSKTNLCAHFAHKYE